MDFNDMVDMIGVDNTDNGWHDRARELLKAGDADGIRDHLAMKLGLATGEVSEAIEELRRPGSLSAVLADYVGSGGKPEGVMVEIADAIIRLIDITEIIRELNGGEHATDLEGVILRKLAYNRTRGHMYGKAM